MSRLLARSALLFVVACTGTTSGPDDDAPSNSDSPGVAPSSVEGALEPAAPTASAWKNQPVPFVAHFHDVTVTFRLDQPTAIDAVLGLADGKVDDASDLGPSLSLGADGRLLAIDGDAYRADAAISYAGTPLDITLRIDLERYRYSVDVNGTALATSYRFGTARATLSRIDTFASLVETSGAALGVADVELGPEWCSVAGQSWIQLYHPAQTGSYRVKLRAQVPDAVDEATLGIGARDAASADDLAAALRFDDQLLARDGATFRADRPLAYAAEEFHDIELAVDLAAQRYSVSVDGVPLATDYAIAGAPNAISQLGLHAASGYVRVCDVMVWSY